MPKKFIGNLHQAIYGVVCESGDAEYHDLEFVLARRQNLAPQVVMGRQVASVHVPENGVTFRDIAVGPDTYSHVVLIYCDKVSTSFCGGGRQQATETRME